MLKYVSFPVQARGRYFDRRSFFFHGLFRHHDFTQHDFRQHDFRQHDFRFWVGRDTGQTPDIGYFLCTPDVGHGIP